MSADLTPRDDRRRRQVLTALAALAVVAAVAALAVRIRLGIDLRDESFYVASPLRWVFGDRPLIDEMSLLQLAGLLVYPAAKAFVWLTGGTHGYVLYMRVVYLAFCVLVSVCVALALGRLVRRQYAVMIALVYVTYVIITYTQVSYDTLGAGFLTIGVALGVPIVCGRAAPTGRRRLLALGAGLAHGLACVAYPTMVVLVPVYAAALALALNDGVTDGLARLVVPPADRDAAVEHQSRDGAAGWRRRAWLAVSAYLAGALVVGLALAAVLLHAGRQNVVRDARGQLAGTKTVDQLGGLAKVHEIAWSVGRLLWWHPWFLLAFALLALLLYYRPRLARTLLLLTPLALFFAGQRAILYASGFAIVYALLVPYLYVFVQPRRRAAAARL
ncbi:MAG TPA: hypothetical protein VK576_00520, partial [Thermoleophilia bacterium]|nr:hypothetical protein [Thermoleophilia bacterium]